MEGRVSLPGIAVERDGAVATVTLHRPDRKNAMTLDSWTALRDAFHELQRDDSVRAVV
ncbi:enoyl-CoA hydratase-related protein, partial [Rhodococcus sp. CX]|uniref:enoyl-CoA hydratase-related protein n=1 Tax=Rhodococcus sp. CX TaxID=2789880 RepID=UPI001E4DCC39